MPAAGGIVQGTEITKDVPLTFCSTTASRRKRITQRDTRLLGTTNTMIAQRLWQHRAGRGSGGPRRRLGRSSVAWLAVAACLFLAGCPWGRQGGGGGWFGSKSQEKTPEQILQEQQEREKKLQEAQQQPLVLGPLRLVPHDQAEPQIFVKPGHVLAAQQLMRANRQDLHIEVQTRATQQDGTPVDWTGTMYHMAWQRGVSLPKGQDKLVDLLFFVPGALDSSEVLAAARVPTAAPRRTWLELALDVKTDARLSQVDRQPFLVMPPHQYHIVVLAEPPERYAFVRRLHSVQAPPDELSESPPTVFYRVQIPTKLAEYAPLPSQWYGWTSTAYVVWDNVLPDRLSAEQQQALLDWLHFGGQLIISGPGSLEKLVGSFLEPYLPAARAATITLEQSDLEALNQYWTITSQRPGAQPARQELRVLAKSFSGIRMELAEHGRFVEGTGRLVCEGAVGRGRIVITAFSLTERLLLGWPSYPSFWNGAILGRPAREYRTKELGDVDLRFAEFPHLTLEPRLATKVRYFSRDTAPMSEWSTTQTHAQPAEIVTDEAIAWGLGRYQPGAVATGVAGWNDRSGVAQAARSALREASGIKVPNLAFVMRALVIYIVLLVPVNWSFFRLIGRVEWAWFAAPFLAIGGAVLIARMAQLDIGFVRSRTEVVVVEGMAGYHRAHMTRYMALYTSLTTRYEMQSDNTSLVVAPFSDEPPFRRQVNDPTPKLVTQRDGGVICRGLVVPSNSASMIHAEEMVDLGGTFRFQLDDQNNNSVTIWNDTKIPVFDACVIGRTPLGTYQTATIGNLLPGQKVTVPLNDLPADVKDQEEVDRSLAEIWGQHPIIGQGTPADETAIRLNRLARLAATLPLARGAWRLVAWNDQPWTDLTIVPDANQFRSATLFLIHLRPGGWPKWQPDKNLYRDVVNAPVSELESTEPDTAEPGTLGK